MIDNGAVDEIMMRDMGVLDRLSEAFNASYEDFYLDQSGRDCLHVVCNKTEYVIVLEPKLNTISASDRKSMWAIRVVYEDLDLLVKAVRRR